MKTSIIIITYNGAKKIPRLLNSINSLTNKDFEVIIVDDGSIDETVKTISSLKLNFTFNLIVQENKGRSAAKNKGASLAQYDILWFIDDDMRVEPGTLNAHLQHHIQHPGSISVGSQLEDEPLMKTDIQKYKCFISNGWRRQIESAENPLTSNDLYMTSANVSVSKNIFNKIGGFDNRLRDAEDLDFVYRAFLDHVPVFYNAAAVGYHMDLITCRSYIIRNRQYMEGYLVLQKLKPYYMEINKRMHRSKFSGKKKWVLSFISLPLYVRVVDNFNIFKILLPMKFRYRFYELLILGLGREFPGRKI